MTNVHDPNSPEHQLLLLLGELRGNMANVAATLGRLEGRIDATEEINAARYSDFSDRISKLEAYRLKIAGFTVGVAFLMTMTKDKLPAITQFIFGG